MPTSSSSSLLPDSHSSARLLSPTPSLLFCFLMEDSSALFGLLFNGDAQTASSPSSHLLLGDDSAQVAAVTPSFPFVICGARLYPVRCRRSGSSSTLPHSQGDATSLRCCNGGRPCTRCVRYSRSTVPTIASCDKGRTGSALRWSHRSLRRTLHFWTWRKRERGLLSADDSQRIHQSRAVSSVPHHLPLGFAANHLPVDTARFSSSFLSVHLRWLS